MYFILLIIIAFGEKFLGQCTDLSVTAQPATSFGTNTFLLVVQYQSDSVLSGCLIGCYQGV